MTQVRSTVRAALAATSLAALAACGGGATSTGAPTFGGVLSANSTPNFSDLQPVLNSAEEQRERVQGFAGSRFTAIPDDRTVVFKGYGGVDLDFAPSTSPDLSVLGDARVVVDFENDQFSGAITNMIATGASNNVTGVLGDFTFTGGSVGGANPNNFSLDYEADLLVGPNDVELSGTMDGIFRGTRANPGDRTPIKAIDAADTNPTIITGVGLNGATSHVIGESFFPTE